jgi:ankyrin repeat protein
MSNVESLHDAVKRGDVERIRALLAADPRLASARSETDPRGTYPLHVAAESDQSAAAQALLDHGAEDLLLDQENGATALSWAAFFGHSKVVEVLLGSGSDPSQRNKHGLTPLGCAVGGAKGQWQDFSDATLADWERCAEILRSHGGVE